MAISSSGNLAENLRFLTGYYRSVAEVCRRLGLNRSQFNRYLSGRATPSRHVFKSICDFFGVEDYEILLPPAEFQRIVGLRPGVGAADGAPRPYVAYLDQLVRRSRRDLAEYQGFYFEYSYSMSRPGLILRSLIRVNDEDGLTTYQRLENMARVDGSEPRVKCKYRGMAFYLNDRIFMLDYDSLTGNEISQTVLYPNYQHRLRQLSGLKLGVSTGHRREPLCARVFWEALGKRIAVRSALRACGLFEADGPEIEPAIKEMIDNSAGMGAFHFRVFAQG